jgi:hypothetical protein
MEKFGISFEKKKSPQESLREILSSASRRTNEEAREAYGVYNLLDSSCAIRPEMFRDAEGYGDEEILRDLERVHEKEVEWSGARDERIREFYKDRYGITDEAGIVRKYKENKAREKGEQMEMLVAALFYKAFGDEFIVARASAYDDYFNGIDTVVIDKKTGQIVCAFDEVHDHEKGERAGQKVEKIRKIAHRNGTTFKYGIALEEGRLVRKAVHNLPVFYLSLPTSELERALNSLGGGQEGCISEDERRLCAQFVSLLEQEEDMLGGEERLPEQVKRNLAASRGVIGAMKEHMASSLRAAEEKAGGEYVA